MPHRNGFAPSLTRLGVPNLVVTKPTKEPRKKLRVPTVKKIFPRKEMISATATRDIEWLNDSLDAIHTFGDVSHSIVMADEEEDEDEVEKFREFLDQISPEDFQAEGPQS